VGDGVSLLREPDAVVPPVRFDERDVETEHGEASEALADERAGTDRPRLNHRATSRLYVRREKALVHSGWESRPGAGSFRPVTIEAAVEVTKPLKPSVQRVAMATW